MLEVETDAHDPLLPGQVFAHRAKKAQLEHDGSLDVSDELPLVSTRIDVVGFRAAAHPSCALLDMRVV